MTTLPEATNEKVFKKYLETLGQSCIYMYGSLSVTTLIRENHKEAFKYLKFGRYQ